MFLKLLLITAFLIALILTGLGIRMLLRRNGTFPETHISRNPEMQKRGITCASDNDTGCAPSAENLACSCCSPGEGC